MRSWLNIVGGGGGGGEVMKCGSEITLNNSLPCSIDTIQILIFCSSLICACASPHLCRLFSASSEQLPDIYPESKNTLERPPPTLMVQAGWNAAIAQNHTYCLVTTPCSAAAGPTGGFP